jgi:type IV pilus assembly protein PilQ
MQSENTDCTDVNEETENATSVGGRPIRQGDSLERGSTYRQGLTRFARFPAVAVAFALFLGGCVSRNLQRNVIPPDAKSPSAATLNSTASSATIKAAPPMESGKEAKSAAATKSPRMPATDVRQPTAPVSAQRVRQDQASRLSAGRRANSKGAHLPSRGTDAAHVSWVGENPPSGAAGPEVLPAETSSKREYIRFPANDPREAAKVRVTGTSERVSLTARDASISVVLGMIAEQHGLNIVSGQDVNERITVTLRDVELDDALDAILGVNGYVWSRENNILSISSLSAEKKSSASIQGRLLRVFTLNYITAADAEKVVTGLLSPVGKSFMHQTSPNDQRRTHEQLVVEDLPYYVQRIEEYLAQVDIPPRQVVVEAHVLQVNLKDDSKHGVNLQQLLTIANTSVLWETTGFAAATAPTSFLRIDGTGLNSLIEALKVTTDAKTLASPKVAVLNGQEAHLQIGSKLGFLVTTTTQTSTLQSVNFLDVGVILKVTPQITKDGQVLMQVKPQVSNGRINPTTNLPESETTEVETKIMLADGEALVIGGLIKESDSNVQHKIPYLGDAWLVGKLFQRRILVRERNEVIIALVPRIVSEIPGCRAENPGEVGRAQTPLLYGPLDRVDRTLWEPQLPDATRRRERYSAPPDYYYLPEEVEEEIPTPELPTPTEANKEQPLPPVRFIPSIHDEAKESLQRSSFEVPARREAPRRFPPI